MERRRFRPLATVEQFNIAENPRTKHENDAVSWWCPFYILSFGIALFFFVFVQSQALPKIVTIEDSKKDPDLFCGANSKKILDLLTSLGPKVFGDSVNEIQAPGIIENELEKIIKQSSQTQSIHFQRQKGNGSYLLDFEKPFFNVYKDAQNVIAMIEGSEGNHSILVNCHYDTVALSPGASDDGISCATMLEILRILSSTPKRLKHNIVFLFNGAEESPLQGSHLFLSHEWAEKCRVVINLEAAGVGGKNILFQSGPGHPWLLKYYANNVPHPHGQVIAEELFQSGIIPSDTDFRIFRDFGIIPGMDFAFWHSGYIYHSSYDSQDYIPTGSYQQIGDNTLALLRALGNADEMNHLNENPEGKMVYYDYLGWFMVIYSESMNLMVNCFAIFTGICSIAAFVGPTNQWRTIKDLVGRLGIIAASMAATVITSVLVGLVLNLISPYVMSWYLNPVIVFTLYWCPGLAAYLLTTSQLEKLLASKCKLSMYSIMHMNMVASQIPWMLLLFLTTVLGLRSSSLFFAPVLVTAVSNLMTHLTPVKSKAYTSFWFHFIIYLPVLLYNMYFVTMVYMMIIPILGRSGSINSELIMAFISSLCTLFLFSFLLPFMAMVKRAKRIALVLFVICLISMLWAIVSGPPYTASHNNPRPQRYLIMHVYKEYLNEGREVSKSDSRFVIYNMDKNSPKTVPIDKILINSLENECDGELYCGLPMLTSRTMALSNRSNWIQSDTPYFFTETELTVRNDTPRCSRKTQTCKLSLTIKGPNRLSFILIPRPGVTLHKWSIDSKVKMTDEWKGRPVHFVHIACGTDECELSVDIIFKVVKGFSVFDDNPITDVVLSGHYMHRKKNKITMEFENFLKRFPAWTDVTAWPSAHKMFII